MFLLSRFVRPLTYQDWATGNGLTGTATFTELSIKVEDVQLSAAGPLVVDLASSEVTFAAFSEEVPSSRTSASTPISESSLLVVNMSLT